MNKRQASPAGVHIISSSTQQLYQRVVTLLFLFQHMYHNCGHHFSLQQQVVFLRPTAFFAHHITRVYSVTSVRRCNAGGPPSPLPCHKVLKALLHPATPLTDNYTSFCTTKGKMADETLTVRGVFVAPTRWLLFSTCRSGRIRSCKSGGHEEAVVERGYCVSTSAPCGEK